jgi:hypothetical protein
LYDVKAAFGAPSPLRAAFPSPNGRRECALLDRATLTASGGLIPFPSNPCTPASPRLSPVRRKVAFRPFATFLACFMDGRSASTKKSSRMTAWTL